MVQWAAKEAGYQWLAANGFVAEYLKRHAEQHTEREIAKLDQNPLSEKYKETVALIKSLQDDQAVT